MPVFKYRSFEEAEQALWNFKPDSKYFARIREFWIFANKLKKNKTFTRGIIKFHNIKEANKS
jgi:hypothetical protein